MIRLLADYMKVRLYIPLSETQKYRSFMIQKQAPGKNRIHIHHFVWGIVCAFAAIGALYWNQVYPGAFLAALAASLIASEAKEMVLQKWGR